MGNPPYQRKRPGKVFFGLRLTKHFSQPESASGTPMSRFCNCGQHLKGAIQMIVMKFGGSSLESASAIERVASIVKSYLAQRPVVVVSAMRRLRTDW